MRFLATTVLSLLLLQTQHLHAEQLKRRTCELENTAWQRLQESISPEGGIGGVGHKKEGIGGTGNTSQNTDVAGGIGGTGHPVNDGIGGTGRGTNEGIGGTGHSNESSKTAGGIGGTGYPATDGIGGTGNSNEPSKTAGGIGGTGYPATDGIGGTGHSPSGGISGTGITLAGNFTEVRGKVYVKNILNQIINIREDDEACNGDRIATADNSSAKVTFTDHADLFVLKNTELQIAEYHYAPELPTLNRSHIKLTRGDIRSVSGVISKTNSTEYSFATPLALIKVIGTDFMLTHLPKREGEMPAGTYTKVNSGEVSVENEQGKHHLRAGQSSHVLLNGSVSLPATSGSVTPPGFCPAN